MILDIDRFIRDEKALWSEFETQLDAFTRGRHNLSVDEIKRFYYLYERVSEDLVKISTFSGEREIRTYLEKLVAQGYSYIHSDQRRKVDFSISKWVLETFPQTFRRNIRAYYLAFAVTMFGALFGGFATVLDSESKSAIIPEQFSHLNMTPDERVASEERKGAAKRLDGAHSRFAANLMTHNTQVSINVCVFGITWGIGTIVFLFYNGVILGSVLFDFIFYGQSAFVFGWLLPHGSTEISAILIAGQAGLIIGGCLLKPGGHGRFENLRKKRSDIITLLGGVTLLLIWSGIVESFFSQYHAPVIPYWVKISFGLLQLSALYAYLFYGGNKKEAVSE